MKLNNLLLTGIILLSYSDIYSQDWFQQDDVWVHRISEGLSGTTGYAETKVVKDTVYEGQDCKLLSISTSTFSIISGSNNSYESELLAYEEDGRVYFLGQEASFQLNYDFNMEVGDTFEMQRQSCEQGITFTLDSLSTIMMNEETLTVQHLSFFDSIWNYSGTRQVIEKAGALNGGFFLSDFHVCFTDAGFSSLCSFGSSDYEFSFQDIDCYELITNTNEINSTNLKVYPNPTTNIVHIETDLTYEQVQVIDLYGRKVIQDANKSIISLENLSSGIYFIQLVNNNKVVSQNRIVKTEQ